MFCSEFIHNRMPVTTFLVCLKEIMTIRTTLYCMCITWSPIKPISSNALTDTEAKTHILQLHDGPLQIPKKKKCKFYQALSARPLIPSSQRTGMMRNWHFSLSNSLQRQRLSLVTHTGSAAWCHPVLPSAVVGQLRCCSTQLVLSPQRDRNMLFIMCIIMILIYYQHK